MKLKELVASRPAFKKCEKSFREMENNIGQKLGCAESEEEQ